MAYAESQGGEGRHVAAACAAPTGTIDGAGWETMWIVNEGRTGLRTHTGGSCRDVSYDLDYTRMREYTQ